MKFPVIPGESETVGNEAWRTWDWFAIVLFFGFLAAVLFIVITAIGDETPEDKREVRQYGDLECIYNIDQDKIEACEGTPQ